MTTIDIEINNSTPVLKDINSSATILFTKNQSKKYIHELDENNILIIERIRDDSAHMYFTDKYNNYINIPEGFVLYDYNSVSNLTEIENGSFTNPGPHPMKRKESFSFIGANFPEDLRPPYDTSFYVIHYNEYYDVTYNDNILFKLTPNYCLEVITEL